MNKGLDLIQRQQIEVISGYPTGNVYIGLTSEELEELEKELKALEIIRKCFYVAKSSGAILLTSYGFDHKEELKGVLL